MNSTTPGNRVLQGIGWVVGSVSLVLLVSAEALTLFTRQALGQVSVATILLALYLASRSYVLGLVGLLFLSVRWLVSWRRLWVKPAAMSRYSPAESRSRRLEKLELRDHQFIEKGMAPVVPSRSSGENDDRNKAPVHPKLAEQAAQPTVLMAIFSSLIASLYSLLR